MCIAICVMISVGAALYITAQALESRIIHDETQKSKNPASDQRRDSKMRRAAVWCTQLAYLMGAVALLLILSCMCCRDVEFGSHHAKDDYD
jgi:hypothetical protein